MESFHDIKTLSVSVEVYGIPETYRTRRFLVQWWFCAHGQPDHDLCVGCSV